MTLYAKEYEYFIDLYNGNPLSPIFMNASFNQFPSIVDWRIQHDESNISLKVVVANIQYVPVSAKHRTILLPNDAGIMI